MATVVAIAAVGATSIVVEVEQLRPRCGAFVLNSRLVSSQHPISVCDATLADRGGTSSQKRRRTMEAGEEEAGYGAFLRAMPTAHTYLGEVRDLPGNSDIRYELARSGGPLRCNLPLLTLPHQVLFPGDTLPLMIPSDDPLTRRLFHRAMAAPPPLKGLFCALTFVPEIFDVASEDPRGVVGTVMEIRQVSVEDDAREDSALSVVARGILRLRIVDLDWIHYLARHPARRSPVAVEAPMPVDVDCDVIPEETFPRRPALPAIAFGKNDRALPLTPHSASVYEAFDAVRLAERVRHTPFVALTVKDVASLPRDPESLSYAVASRMPLDASDRWRALVTTTTTERLRLLLRCLAESAACDLSLTCRRCGVAVAKMSDIVVVSDGGATGSYVNPGGVVHDMVTVRPRNAGRELRLHGDPSAEHSWFPGYRWTIATCGTCGVHVGWRFTPERVSRSAQNGEGSGSVSLDEGDAGISDRTDGPDRAHVVGGEFYGILRRATVAAEDGVGRSRLRVPPAWPPTWPEGVDVTMEESQSDTSEGEQDDVDADVDGSDGGDGGDEAAREDPCVD